MHKRKSIRILYVVHLFKYRGRKRVPIDIIKASAFRRQAKRRCLWVGLTVALRLVDLATLTFRTPSERICARA